MKKDKEVVRDEIGAMVQIDRAISQALSQLTPYGVFVFTFKAYDSMLGRDDISPFLRSEIEKAFQAAKSGDEIIGSIIKRIQLLYPDDKFPQQLQYVMPLLQRTAVLAYLECVRIANLFQIEITSKVQKHEIGLMMAQLGYTVVETITGEVKIIKQEN